MATGNAAEWRDDTSTSAMRLVKKYALGMLVARRHSATCTTSGHTLSTLGHDMKLTTLP